MTLENCLEIIRVDLSSRSQKLGLVCILKDPISRFHLYLRLCEYLRGRSSLAPLYYFTKWRFLSLSSRLGFSIPENTLGKGVYLPHYGTIVVNSRAYVGDYSVLNVGVVIGRHPSSKDKVPKLGEGVYLGPGVKVFGSVVIGAHSVIGANGVVTGDVPPRELWVGSPAKTLRQISENEYQDFVSNPKAWEAWRAPSTESLDADS